jgi:hypothetical protein
MHQSPQLLLIKEGNQFMMFPQRYLCWRFEERSLVPEVKKTANLQLFVGLRFYLWVILYINFTNSHSKL